MNQARNSIVQKISKNTAEFAVVQTLCNRRLMQNNTDFVGQPATWALYRKVLLDVSPTCENMLVYCEYSRTPFNCTTKFQKILTDDGLCCIFNGLSRHLLVTQMHKLV